MRDADIDVLWTARYDYPAAWTLETHQHRYFQMIYFASGRGTFTLAGKEQPIREGMLFLIAPDAPHGLRSRTALKTLDIKFEIAGRSLRRELAKAAGFVQPGEPAVPALFERIRHEGEQKRPYYREMCAALVAELLLLYRRAYEHEPVAAHEPVVAGVQSPLLRKALAVVHERHSQPLAIAEIGQALNCSERAIRKLFQQSLGIRPLDYLHRYRIARAKELMEFSDYELKRIAETVGFKNVQHFTRIFKELEELTPGAWRRKFYEGIRKDININPRFSNPSWSTPTVSDKRKSG